MQILVSGRGVLLWVGEWQTGARRTLRSPGRDRRLMVCEETGGVFKERKRFLETGRNGSLLRNGKNVAALLGV